MDLNSLFHGLGVIVLVMPALLLVVFGLTALLNRPVGELLMARWTETTIIVGLLAAVSILGLMLFTGVRNVSVELGNWVVIPEQHFHFHLRFVFDRLSVPFVILTLVLVGTIGAFANRYLHREPGYGRFFLYYAVFLLGMIVASLAGTIETLFIGWELVGLSSALLVAYFHERASPVINGLRVWAIYRFADAAFLIAALALHHLTGAGDFSGLMGTEPWPNGTASLTENQALFVGLMLLIAAAGKSGLIPFSGWLPRAMEGPTPSSAVFYGALSVHLGAYLLLRVSPLLDASMTLRICVITLGLASAVFGALAARAQSDIKSALAFASLTQVGIIVVEIGLGLHYIALIHIIGHACLRTLQLLRAPSILHDYHTMENAIGENLPQQKSALKKMIAPSAQKWLYRIALERGHLDSLLDQLIVEPFVKFFLLCNRLEKKWTDYLSGDNQTNQPDQDKQSIVDLSSMEDLK